MPGLAALFSGSNFQATVQTYCQQIGWRIAEINSNQAKLIFNASSGRTQTLYIIRYDTTLEFSVPSAAIFVSDDAIPGMLSTIMLKRNSEVKVGFWCIETLSGKRVFSFMHNAEIELINVGYFERVVRFLVKETDEFEDLIRKILR